MSTNSLRFLLASAAVGSIVTVAAPAMANPWADMFIDNAVVNEIGAGCVIDWDTMEGHTTAGAGFYTAVLSKTMSWTPADVQSHWGAFCPTSTIYFSAIGTGTHFTQITKAANIQKDDVIVINAGSGYGGHTMLVDGAPILITHPVSPLFAGTTQWKVPIVDSTSTAHGCTDSRWTGTCTPLTGTMDPGAGRGNIRLYTDTISGNLLGYTWSVTASNTSYYSPLTRPYRVGRFDGP